MTGIDLHVHSTYSDGLLGPEALCALAFQKHVRMIALCDHDTTDGLAPMAATAQALSRPGRALALIPSLEVSTGGEGRTHILGYGVHADNAALRQAIQTLRCLRMERGARMVAALRELGVDIPAALLPGADAPGMAVGRPHVARALVATGAVGSMEQAFDRYLAEGRPAYIPLSHLSAADAIRLLRQAGAVPVLAHPARLGLSPQMLEALVEALQGEGLMGVEAFHPSAVRGDARALEAMARRRGLLVTGGSDFHGDRGSRAKLGGLPSGWNAWADDLAALEAAIAAAHAAAAAG